MPPPKPPGDGKRRTGRGTEAAADASAAKPSRSKDEDKGRSRDRRPAAEASASAATASSASSKTAHASSKETRPSKGDDKHRSKDKERERRHREEGASSHAADGGDRRKDREHKSKDEREKPREERRRHKDEGTEESSRKRDDKHHRDRPPKDESSSRHTAAAAAASAAAEGGTPKVERKKPRDEKDRERRREDKERDAGKDRHHDDKRRERHRDDKEHRREDEGKDAKDRHRDDKDRRREERHKEREREERRRDKEREERHRDRDQKHKDEPAKEEKPKPGERREEKSHKSKDDTKGEKRRHKEKKDRKGHEEKGAASSDQKETESASDKAKQREAEMLAKLRDAESGSEMLLDESRGAVPAAPTMESDGAEGSSSEIVDDVNYNDDFEDYEEDFEEGSDADDEDEDEEANEVVVAPSKEVLELSRAMMDENQKIVDRKKKSKTTGRADTPAITSRRRVPAKFLDFAAAQKRHLSSEVAQKTRRRGEELAQLIELDTVKVELFDLAPQSEYELYMKRFGKSNTAQVSIQCTSDVMDQEIQTDDIIEQERWTQCPPSDLRGIGVGVGSTGVDSSCAESVQDAYQDFQSSVFTADMSKKLQAFLQKAGQVCSVILDEQASKVSSTKLQPPPKDSTVLAGSTPLSCSWPSVADRHVVCTQLTSQQDHQLLTALSAPHSTTSRKAKSPLSTTSGLLALWHLTDLAEPRKLLSCQAAAVTSCCFSPGKPVLVAAGTVDGTIMVWDLRESTSLHRMVEVGDNRRCVCQQPTYSTDGTSLKEVHSSAIVDLVAVDTNASSSSATAAQDKATALSFQVASLDEWGTVKIWVAVEPHTYSKEISELDVGLVPGGRVRLVFVTTITMTIPAPLEPRSRIPVRTHAIRFRHGAANHFLVGGDSGSILHGQRQKAHAIPNQFVSHVGSTTDVVSIDMSPWEPDYFLAGCSDGSVRLYHVNKAMPLVTWTQFASSCSGVLCVRWLPLRPCVFLVADTASQLITWDLSSTDTHPVSKDDLSSFGSITSFSVVPLDLDVNKNRPSQIVLAFDNGDATLHNLAPEFSRAADGEPEKLAQYLGALYRNSN